MEAITKVSLLVSGCCPIVVVGVSPVYTLQSCLVVVWPAHLHYTARRPLAHSTQHGLSRAWSIGPAGWDNTRDLDLINNTTNTIDMLATAVSVCLLACLSCVSGGESQLSVLWELSYMMGLSSNGQPRRAQSWHWHRFQSQHQQSQPTVDWTEIWWCVDVVLTRWCTAYWLVFLQVGWAIRHSSSIGVYLRTSASPALGLACTRSEEVFFWGKNISWIILERWLWIAVTQLPSWSWISGSRLWSPIRPSTASSRCRPSSATSPRSFTTITRTLLSWCLIWNTDNWGRY